MVIGAVKQRQRPSIHLVSSVFMIRCLIISDDDVYMLF